MKSKQVIDKMDEKAIERTRLEKEYGDVWNTQEVQEVFKINGFCAPYVAVTRKSDGMEGSLEFQHMPRFYFNFNSLT